MHKAGVRGSTLEYPTGRYTVEQREKRMYRVGITTGYPYTDPFAKGVYKGIVQDFTTSGNLILEETERRSEEAAAWLMEW